MSQTTVDSCDSALGEQQTIFERNELDLSSIVSPVEGMKQVIDCSCSAAGLSRQLAVGCSKLEWLYSALVSKANTGWLVYRRRQLIAVT